MQIEGEVEHIFLIFCRLGQLAEPFTIHNHMAGGAGERAFSGAFNINTVAMRDFQDGKAKRRFHFFARSVTFNEYHFRHG